MTSHWIDCKIPRGDGALARVFCFPYAGGDGNVVFRNWQQQMPPWLEVHCLNLPGRGVRMDEKPLTDLYYVAEKIGEQILEISAADERPRPFYFVGYSLGALISFEVLRFLQNSGAPVFPEHVYLAGHIAPSFFGKDQKAEEKLYQLSDDKFRLALQRYNMVDETLLRDEEFCKYFLPIIRSDLELDETYVFQPLENPLPTNLSLFNGDKDVAAPFDQMLDWTHLFDVKEPTRTHQYEEFGHEFLIEKSEDLRERIAQDICKYFQDPWPQVLARKASLTPDLTAVSMIDEETNQVVNVSLADFMADAWALASWMYEIGGVRSGDRVLLVAESSYDSFLSMMTFGLMNVVYAPCPPDIQQEDLENRIKNLEPTLAYVCEESDIEKKLAESKRACPVFYAEKVDYKSWIGRGRYPQEMLFEDFTLEDPCFVAHTSGSTGLPKPILLYHKNILNNLQWRSYTFPMNGNQDCYGISIFWFWYFMLPLMNDYRIAPIPQKDMLNVEVYLDKMQRLNVTHIEISPTYAGLMSKVGMGHEALKKLSLLVLMGEVVHLDTVKHFQLAAPRCRCVNIYSLSETNDITYCMLSKEFLKNIEMQYPEMSAAPIGTPAWNVDIYLKRDDESLTSIDEVLKSLKGREVCEMFIKSEELMIQGYVNNAKATAKSLVHSIDGTKLFRCNDLVTILQKDPVILVVTGRADRTVNVRGARVGLDRVTGIIKKLQEVKDCALVWNSDTQQLFCFCVLESGDKKQLTIVREKLSKVLTHAETPSRFVVIPELPLNKRTKVDMRKLREMLLKEQETKSERVLDEDPVIAKIEQVWMNLLKTSEFDLTDDFFNVGGHSLLIVQLASALKLPVPEVMDKRTIMEQAELVRKRVSEKATNKVFQLKSAESRPLDSMIAVVGLAGRWPNAVTKEQFWQNMVNKADCFTELTENDMLQAGVPKELFMRDNWVRRAAVIPPEYVECFDAKLFNMSERDARIIDPNQRMMMEMCFEALEDAGYAPFNAGNVGVFAAGAALPTYLQNCLKHELGNISMVQLTDPGLYVQVELGNDKDYIPTRVSYNLNLTGPSKNVQSACSSGLVALADAVENLRAGKCDAALAGAICVTTPMKTGYLYQEGMVFSKDGRVRPFDAEASGTMFTNGGSVVMLKRLDDAIRDRDHIYSVVRGIAVNNDGHRGKKAYAAPSVKGQSEVIAAAYNDARIHPERVSYLECHGTGTLVGDPIELEGLAKVFSGLENEIAIGSMKANIGHANSAAGICSFAKLQLMFENKTICPQLNLNKLNPGINFEDVPFHVPVEAKEWKPQGETRVAGVSSFGMGGTNAHAVCEEYLMKPSSYDLPSAIFTLSANNASSLAKMQAKLASHLSESDLNPGDVSFTLTCGRHSFDHRLSFVADNLEDLVSKLRDSTIPMQKRDDSKVVFVFPGQGSQHANCGSDLYETLPHFQEIVQEAIDILGYDFRNSNINSTRAAQVSIFVHSYAMASTLESLGLNADCVMGHSVGEIVAATHAGLFSFADGLRLIDLRGEIMDEMKEGSMCTVFAEADFVEDFIEKWGDLGIACYNAPEINVVSGPTEDIEKAVNALNAQGIKAKILPTASAFHSHFITREMQKRLATFINSLSLGDVKTQVLSNLTGKWVEANRFELLNPQYWATHMRQPVRWTQQIETLKKEYSNERVLFVECGPGKSMCSLIKRCGIENLDWHVTNTMRHPKAATNDITQLHNALARIFELGFDIDFSKLFTEDFAAQNVRRVSLPTYEFDRKHCWVGPSDLGFSSEVIYESRWSQIGELSALKEIQSAVYFGDEEPSDLPFDFVELSNVDLSTLDDFWFVGGATSESATEIAQSFLPLLKKLAAVEKKLNFNVLVREEIAYSGVWGMCKTLNLENSFVNTRFIKWDGSVVPNVSEMDDFEFRVQSGETRASKLQKVKLAKNLRKLNKSGYYVITGGTRGLGFGLAEHLVSSGVHNIIILGRKAPDSTALANLRAQGGNIEVFLCDLLDSAKLCALPHQTEICGIFHCAGVLRDALILNTEEEDLNLVFQVKMAIEDLLSLCPKLDFTVLFSSTSALLGAGGQATYSGANTFLDWLASENRKYDIYSVQWAGWSEIGMSVDTDLQELSGERHISPKVGYHALDSILSLPSGVYSVMDISSWTEFAPNFPHLSSFFESQIPSTSPSATKKKQVSLRDFIVDVTGTSDFDASLYSLGFDSLDIVNFRNRIQANYNKSLPLTTFLDQGKTIGHLYTELSSSAV